MEIIPVQPPPKNFANGGMYRTVRCGPRGVQLSEKSLTLPSEEPACPPPVRCKCKGGAQVVKSFYKQPPRPKNFAPVNVYRTPVEKIEDGTIYKMSFLPSDGERPDLVLPKPNIGLSNARFTKETVHKMSFAGTYVPPAEAVKPCNHYLGGHGPMSNATTNRCDYYPKDGVKSQAFVPSNNLGLTNAPFESNTTNTLSYMFNENIEKASPILPVHSLHVPNVPVDGKTIQRMSYQPCKVPHKMFLPWAQKKPYQTPNIPMSSDSVYRNSYVPSDDNEKTKCIYPMKNPNILGDGNKFEGNTIYHMSFKANEGSTRQDKFVPRNNIHLVNAKMDGRTTQKLSFMPNEGYVPPSNIKPCNHNVMMGRGPMACGTTTRCDYQAMEGERSLPFRPTNSLGLSDAAFSNHTINRLSFMDPQATEVAQKFVPHNQLAAATGRMEQNTIQKMSYQPVQPVDPGPMPWAERRTYRPPAHAMVDDTCYRMSFEPPGDWVGGGGSDACQCDPCGGCPCFAK